MSVSAPPPPPRVRMFAGPNGSGKSTIKAEIENRLGAAAIGYWINADEIEKALARGNGLRFSDYSVASDEEGLFQFIRDSSLFQLSGLPDPAEILSISDNLLSLVSPGLLRSGSYIASILSDYLRNQLLQSRQTFTFETVMSYPDKVDFMRRAQAAGFRTYLYFVATSDAEVNVSRVRNRVRDGGHDVDPDRIVNRYHRSLDLLLDAIRASNRAYIFDNSGKRAELIAEVSEGSDILIKTDSVPKWFVRSVLDKA